MYVFSMGVRQNNFLAFWVALPFVASLLQGRVGWPIGFPVLRMWWKSIKESYHDYSFKQGVPGELLVYGTIPGVSRSC